MSEPNVPARRTRFRVSYIMVILFLQELLLFAAAQVIGLFVALRGKALAVEIPASAFKFGPVDIIVLAAIIFFFIYFARRFSRRSVIFFRSILALAIFAGSQTVFSIIFESASISFFAAVLLAWAALKLKIVFLHDLAVILAIGGIGGILGLSLTPLSVIFILVALSFYDIVAVYKTRHMVKMAEDMIKSRAIFGIILPRKPKGWGENLERVRPGEEFMILGSGDLMMPLLLITSSAWFNGLKESLFVMFFSFLGLALTYILFITQKERRPMAALPPIAVASIIGYIISVVL